MDKELMALMASFGKSGDAVDEFRDRLHDSQKLIADAVSDSVTVNDSYGNPLLSVGRDDMVEKYTSFSLSNDSINWTLWLALYNDSWVFRRAIDKPAQDEISCGVSIIMQDKSKLQKVYKAIKPLRNSLIELLQWGALFGGSIAAVMLDNMNDKDYAKPLSKEKLKSAKSIKLYVTDRWYGVRPHEKTVTNMNDLDFGKPVGYDIAFPDGKTITFHHDYIIRYEHRTAPRLVKNGMLQGWGYAEGAHIFTELSKNDKLKVSIQSLIDKSLIEVIKMPGMRGVFMGASEENQDQLKKRLEMVNWARNYNSLTFLDQDDEYQIHGFSGLGGLNDLLSTSMWEIAAALEMQGVLYGDLKQGFSQDSDIMERYADTIHNRCESWVRIVYAKLLNLMYIRFDIDEPVEFEFKSLLTKKQDKDKMEGIKDYAAFLTTLLNDGVIELYQYAEALRNFMNDGEVAIPIEDEDIKRLKEKQVEENEAFDIETEEVETNEKPRFKAV